MNTIILSVGLPILGTALFLAIFLPLLFHFLRNHPAAQTILQYYTALQRQDYAAAFQCISATSPYHLGNSRQSSESFINNARNAEYSLGSIRSFSLSARMSIKNGTANYHLNVVRDRGAYTVKFLLVKGPEGWKIIGFDRI